MSQFNSDKDYYGVLGVDKDASQVEIDRQYKRQAAKAHPVQTSTATHAANQRGCSSTVPNRHAFSSRRVDPFPVPI